MGYLRATIDILALYNFSTNIFDKLKLPDTVERQTVIDLILMDCADLEILYPDPSAMADAIGYWSAARCESWRRMALALDAEYDPIANYDRKEHREVNTIGHGSSSDRAFEPDSMQVRTSADSDGLSTEDATLSGNIGTTTTQQMQREELDIRKRSLFQIISDEFRDKFCLLIY